VFVSYEGTQFQCRFPTYSSTNGCASVAPGRFPSWYRPPPATRPAGTLVDMTAPRATTQYTRESLIKPFRTPKDLTLHPPMPLYVPLLTPQTPLLHNINVKVEVTLTPTPTLILSHVSALMLFHCPRLALYTHIYASPIPLNARPSCWRGIWPGGFGGVRGL